MKTYREAMQQALDALEAMKAEFRALDLPYGSKAYAKANEVSHDLRERLAQPEQCVVTEAWAELASAAQRVGRGADGAALCAAIDRLSDTIARAHGIRGEA